MLIHHEVVYPGFKYNMSDVQASLGIHQLKRLDDFIERRKEITNVYNDVFKTMDTINIPGSIRDIKHAYHLYVIILDTDKLEAGRDVIMQALGKENIGIGLHFRSLHVQHYYKESFGYQVQDLPVAGYLSDRILSLPLYPKMSQYDIDTVVKAVSKVVNYYKR